MPSALSRVRLLRLRVVPDRNPHDQAACLDFSSPTHPSQFRGPQYLPEFCCPSRTSRCLVVGCRKQGSRRAAVGGGDSILITPIFATIFSMPVDTEIQATHLP